MRTTLALLSVLLVPLARAAAPTPAGGWAAVLKERRAWWSLQPVRAPLPPAVKGAIHPVDAFILARLEKAGLRPAPPAERRTLIRRLSLVLTGLPPSPAEVEAFVADRRPDAYERLVDRLLASPHFG